MIADRFIVVGSTGSGNPKGFGGKNKEDEYGNENHKADLQWNHHPKKGRGIRRAFLGNNKQQTTTIKQQEDLYKCYRPLLRFQQ